MEKFLLCMYIYIFKYTKKNLMYVKMPQTPQVPGNLYAFVVQNEVLI